MSLTDALNKWANSKEGRKKIEAAHRAAIKSGKSFGTVPGGDSLPDFYENELRRLLTKHIREAGFEFDEYIERVGCRWDNARGKWDIQLQFDPAQITRESMYSEGYPDGVYDIVALMNHGYKADDYVYDGAARSLREREGAFFIQKAVDEFNALYGEKAAASYHEKYDW